MKRRADESLCSGAGRDGERGVAFVAAVFATAALGAMVYFTTVLSSTELADARRSLLHVKAFRLAEAGIERGIHFTKRSVTKTAYMDPLVGLKQALADGNGGYKQLMVFDAVPVLDGNDSVGEISVSITAKDRGDGLDVTIHSTGYFPAAPRNMPQGRQPVWESMQATVRVEREPSRVFDYAYFLNNWGWFYGSTIYNNGSIRTNGQFDVGGYTPTITGQTNYDSLTWLGNQAKLSGYNDANGDTVKDGKDGGIFSGWDVVGVENVQGEGGKSKNQHDFQDPIEMPNLTDLSLYEKKAKDQGGEVKVGTDVLSNAVFGDESGEHQNLYLHGTEQDPVEITGTVVVRGNVVISGVVKGQGSIFAGGNIYVPSDLSYADPPSTTRPAGPTTAETEAWLTANKDKDMLGLFARENIVLGDHTNWTWRYYVSNWLGNTKNKSKEDAGEDGIPNTKKGKDGIANTVDDDVLEDDGIFTTEKYTAQDQALGLIPPGKTVGDVIPGTGEDIDGDGQFDATTSLADLDLTNAINSTNWGGNFPTGGVSSFSSISSMAIKKIEATLYTNHTLAWVTLPWGEPIHLNGAVVARNESIVYGGTSLNLNYDNRLLGGNSALAQLAFELPKTVAPLKTIAWTTLDHDPHSPKMGSGDKSVER